MPPEVRGPAPSWFSSNARKVLPFSLARSNAAYRKRPSKLLQPFTMSVFGVLLPVMKSQPPGSVSLSPPENLVSDPFAGSSAGVTDPAMSCQSVRPFGPVAWLPSSPAKQLNGSAHAAQALPAQATAKISRNAETSTIEMLARLIDLVERIYAPFHVAWRGFRCVYYACRQRFAALARFLDVFAFFAFLRHFLTCAAWEVGWPVGGPSTIVFGLSPPSSLLAG